jgi:KipI family sensor histidine kinase inhibitor
VSRDPWFLPVGQDALLVELGSRERAAAAYRVVRAIVGGTAPIVVRDVVPAATTVLLDGVSDVGAWRGALTSSAIDAMIAVAEVGAADDPVVIPVRYDGDDLEVVARAWACSPTEVAERHASTAFTVAFCGFAPGFAYCTSDPPLPEAPRRPDPRPRVPAGSVGVAAEYCGIYPRAMPGGWQLIGTTDARLFDVRRDPPALLMPGARVRFEAQ